MPVIKSSNLRKIEGAKSQYPFHSKQELLATCRFMSAPYQAAFPYGTSVQIKERMELERILETSNPTGILTPHQLCDAGMRGMVDSVSYDPTGNPLYTLERIGGTWTEECLVLW
jgi:hypothetical protein